MRIMIVLALLLSALPALAATRPNILLLVAEDMSPHVGAFGDRVAVTPNLDKLAATGVRYTNVFTAAGVCAPSRAALITGISQIRTGTQHMRTSGGPLGSYKAVPPTNIKAFPELLRAAGYYTFTDSKLDYQFSSPMSGSGPFTIWDAEGSDGTEHLWKDRDDGQPFFGMINFGITHESGTFGQLGSWPHSFTHLVMQVMRAWGYGIQPENDPVKAEQIVLPPYYPDIPSVRREVARHYNNIHVMDQQVAKVLDQLRQDGLADNTIVIWTADHGDGLPRSKRELYDSGLKVPMIIYWPERLRPPQATPGSIETRLVSFIDLAPTLLALAGAQRPDYLEGQNFLDPTVAPNRYIFAARDRMDETMDRQRAVRDERFKYVRSWYPQQPGGHELAYRDNQAMTRDMRDLWRAGKLNADQARWFEAPGEEQLYDLRNDPFELHNLAGDPLYQAERARLRATLDEWLARGDRSEQSEAEMVAGFLNDGEQRVTPDPVIARDGDRIRISSEVPGASIGYRLDGGRWRLYTAPIEAGAAHDIEAKAVRYGWQESEVVSLSR